MTPPQPSTWSWPRPHQAPPAAAGRTATAPGKSGFAILLALLVLLALGTLGTGLLFISTQEARVSRALVHAVRARAAAESAARAVLATWNAPAYRRLAPGAALHAAMPLDALDPDIDATVRVERLAGDLFLIRAETQIRPPSGARARAAAGLLVRAIWPAEFAADFTAALSAAGPVVLLPGAVVDGTGGEARAAGDCPPDSGLGIPHGPRAGVAIEDAAVLRAEPGAVLDGAPPLVAAAHLADPAAFAGLGPLAMADLARLADRIVDGARESPGGGAHNACDAAAEASDGPVDPTDPGAPCGGEVQLFFATAGLALSGAAQGVLIVDGDLDLEPGAAFTGAILATGRFALGPGATVTGAVRAREASIAGTIRFDACALANALGGAPGLGRPLRPAGRSWLPTF